MMIQSLFGKRNILSQNFYSAILFLPPSSSSYNNHHRNYHPMKYSSKINHNHRLFHHSIQTSSNQPTHNSSDGSEISEPEETVASVADSSFPPLTPLPSPSNRLIITDRARRRLQTVLEPDELLRIGIRGGGCSGFEYEISVVPRSTINSDQKKNGPIITREEEDILFEDKVVVDKESIEYINGAQLDYEQELIRSGFRVVNNPMAEKGCSCGASFSFKF